MSRTLKGLVSKRKKRFQQDGFDLDLSYISERIIAMGFPAEKLEGVYRNHIDDVARFLQKRHENHYKIYHLCDERDFNVCRFSGPVAKYPFRDHNAPQFEQVMSLCEDAAEFLSRDKENIIAINCKAGKGRTGVMVCACLLYLGRASSSAEALNYYGVQRTDDGKGVTIPSQRRYVDYFARLLTLGTAYYRRRLRLRRIHVTGINAQPGSLLEFKFYTYSNNRFEKVNKGLFLGEGDQTVTGLLGRSSSAKRATSSSPQTGKGLRYSPSAPADKPTICRSRDTLQSRSPFSSSTLVRHGDENHHTPADSQSSPASSIRVKAGTIGGQQISSPTALSLSAPGLEPSPGFHSYPTLTSLTTVVSSPVHCETGAGSVSSCDTRVDGLLLSGDIYVKVGLRHHMMVRKLFRLWLNTFFVALPPNEGLADSSQLGNKTDVDLCSTPRVDLGSNLESLLGVAPGFQPKEVPLSDGQSPATTWAPDQYLPTPNMVSTEAGVSGTPHEFLYRLTLPELDRVKKSNLKKTLTKETVIEFTFCCTGCAQCCSTLLRQADTPTPVPPEQPADTTANEGEGKASDSSSSSARSFSTHQLLDIRQTRVPTRLPTLTPSPTASTSPTQLQLAPVRHPPVNAITVSLPNPSVSSKASASTESLIGLLSEEDSEDEEDGYVTSSGDEEDFSAPAALSGRRRLSEDTIHSDPETVRRDHQLRLQQLQQQERGPEHQQSLGSSSLAELRPKHQQPPGSRVALHHFSRCPPSSPARSTPSPSEAGRPAVNQSASSSSGDQSAISSGAGHHFSRRGKSIGR